MNLHAEIHFTRGEWDQAIAYLEEFPRAGNSRLATRKWKRPTDEKLGLAWLEYGDMEKARNPTSRRAAHCATHGVGRHQATGETCVDAWTTMRKPFGSWAMARSNAGEGWSEVRRRRSSKSYREAVRRSS